MNILVTGSTRGIGKAISESLLCVGDVYVTGRNEKLLKESNAAGYCVCDLTRDIEVLCEYVKDKKIDVLVNNAGEYVYGAIETMSPEQIESIVLTNLVAPIRLIESAVGYMKGNRFGRIINIGSISGVMGEAYASLYSSTKSGLIGLTKALALELAQYDITVNTINPGWVDTQLAQDSVSASEFTREEVVESIPQRRFVTPQEVADLVKYLISDEARGITGQSINLCAGLSVGI